MNHPTCTQPGCDKPARSKTPRTETGALCKMHYHRWYRHGAPDRTANHGDITASHGRRYRVIYTPGHPMAGPKGLAYEHRVILYDTIGPDQTTCHWCAKPIAWLPGRDPNAIEADHLNGIGDDNNPTNIVAACHRCNATRARQLWSNALRAAGWWSNHDTITTRHATIPGPAKTEPALGHSVVV